MPDRRAGDEIANRYVIEREIGRGGMGAVYAALDTRLGRRVALKTLTQDSTTNTRQRLETEARAVASIEHPSIVTLFDVIEDGGETVLVMELVAGQTLREVLKERALTGEEVAMIVYELGDALSAAHAKGLVHRDVKPDNVMQRQDGRVALLDFGVAKLTAEAASAFAPTTTGAGVIVGTPAYLSPEQAHAQPIGPATDQFALAVTAYELLTRTLPWPTTTPMLLIAAIVSSDPKPLEGFDASVSAVFARALAKKPADRFPEVRDFATALGAALGVVQPSRPRSLLPASASGRIPATVPSQPTPRPLTPIEIEKTLRATASLPPAQRARRARPVAIAIAAVAVVTSVIVALRMRAEPSPSPGASASASAAPLPLAITDVPADGTTNAAARAKFREAMRALAIGRGNTPVIALLDGALEADPEFASAALQRAVVSFRIAGSLDANGRRAFRSALEQQGKLGPRDTELLQALGPSFADPPDWAASGTRLEALLAKRPGDAQAWEALGILRFKLSQLDAAEEAFVREQAADPHAYTSYFLRGHLRANHTDLEGARRLFAECIDRVPATIECRGAIVALDRVVGECGAADRIAREAAALAPDEPSVYAMRAETAASLGAPRDALVDLLAQKRAHMIESMRAEEQANDDYALAMREGDFPAALAALDAADRASSAKLDEINKRVVSRTAVLREMGDAKKGADAALAFLDRMTAHALPEQPWQDPTGALLAVASAGGRLDDRDFIARRDAWIASWRTRLDATSWTQDGVIVWLGAYASLDTPSSARAKEAVAALESFGKHDLARLDTSVRQSSAEVGALLLAAGRTDEAMPHLETATRWCRLTPFVHAFVSLGEARAIRGDVHGACDAFAEVERRWGRAKPRSLTLEAARADAKKYACPR